MKKLLMMLSVVGLSMFAVGCNSEPDSPGEAIEEAGDAVEDAAEEAGDAVEDSVE